VKINAGLLQKIIKEELTIQTIADDSQMSDGEMFGDGGSARMVRSQLFRIAKFAQSLHDQLADNDELPEWVQSKVAGMANDIDEVHGHLDHKMADHTEEPTTNSTGGISSIIDLIANLPDE
jgi:hypothetical protein